MKRLLGSKAFIVLLAIAGLVALILLSAALRDLSFRPSDPVSFSFGRLPSLVNPASPGKELPLWKIMLFSGLLLVILVVLFFFLEPEMRKQLLLRMFRFLLTMAAVWLALNYAYERGNLKQTLDLIFNNTPGEPANFETTIPVYVPPQISPWLVFGASFVIALGLVALGWLFYTRRAKASLGLSVEEIAGIAREAQAGLQDGRDWDDAIVRCYIRMNEVVTRERGLVRQLGTTPAEFALRMERAGLPGEAVRTLTRLFEGVRYGGKTTGPAERDLASAALSAILHDCGVNA